MNPSGQTGRLVVLLSLFLLTGTAQAQRLVGVVIGVHDGDTLTLLTDDRQTLKVRLAKIDAPELSQAYGQAAKHGLSDTTYRRRVTVEYTQQDRYGRLIGHVDVGGQDVNLAQVAKGLAWVYRQYSNDPVFLQAERTAQASHLGLWQDPNPIAPWEFRHAEDAR
ncbi:thermonuclease family protein [Methylomonas koyamae]|uniref:thermonuclease family protein n=1 Tax=Methylomonas koyamae TaxID=702114 RepID=UPI001126B393|nr:thermonuclease family protein [Methylomonas koyamae]TPQ24766.1 nuclease [Methylomonas koyamae]